MIKYWKYMKYVIGHKWYVMLECFKCGLYWRGITHDLSKLLPSEFIPYAQYFYGNQSKDGINRGRKNGSYRAGETIDDRFNYAWLLHQKRNKHHWQYWVLPLDDGGVKIFEIPEKYMLEMICDWNGAGMAINGKKDTLNWYNKNKEHMQLNPKTRANIESRLRWHNFLNNYNNIVPDMGAIP